MSGRLYRGVVTDVARARGLVAIEVGRYGFGVTVAEVQGLAELAEVAQVDGGDVLSGDLPSLGDQTVRNDTKGRDVRLLIQAVDVTAQEKNLLMRRSE